MRNLFHFIINYSYNYILHQACRKNVNTGTIKELLEDLQISPDKVSRFVASHKVKHLTLKSVLSATKPSRGSILDVKWKLEYCRGELVVVYVVCMLLLAGILV